ncbi:unnamed protein product [Ixodes persulcatus]
MSSSYFRKLEEPARNRYREKLTIAGEELPDPLDADVRKNVFSTDARQWPRLEIGDIYVYLVEGICFYTREQFKSYKLEDGYNLFLSGKVRDACSFGATIENARIVLITGQVEASQTLGKYHQPWAVVKKEGTVLSAHCTCMAGLGEACSHVPALLFRVEVDVKFGIHDPSSTSVECRWITASSTAQASRVASIDFIKPSKRRRINTISAPKEVSSHPEATAEQLKDFLKAVKRLAPDTLVLRSLTDSEDTDTAASGDVEDDEDPLQVPETIVDMACLYGSLKGSAAKEATFSVTECDQVKLRTRAQASSDEWSRQRVGRITASILGKVLSCCTGAEGIVSQVMGYTKTPDVFSVRWGRENEVKARNRFITDEAPKHSGFEVRKCGLFVDSERPYLGASPDGVVSCCCCTDAVLEIKCPASCANLTIDEAKVRLPYLDADARLKEGHLHYAQVQMQMALVKTTRAFFVVFTNVDINVEEVKFNECFWNTAVSEAEKFYFSHIFTEIHGRELLKKIEDANTMCICKTQKSGSVLRCKLCNVAVHLKCAKLRRTPKTWVCLVCKLAK